MVDARKPQRRLPLPWNADARVAARILFALTLAALALWMATDFLAPLGWAVVITIAVWPVYVRFCNRLPAMQRKTLAPLLFTALTGIVILLPGALALNKASQEAQGFSQALAQYREKGIPTPPWLAKIPAVGTHAAAWWQSNLNDADDAVRWLGRPGNVDVNTQAAATRAIGAEVLHRLFLFIIALIALFVLLRHGAWAAGRTLDSADRFLGDPGERLASKLTDAVRGTVNGTITVAVGEGALIGVAYFAAGVPNALLFTLLTMAFAMIPLGAWAAFTSASLLLLFQGGDPWLAAAVFLFGAVVMVIGDFLVWPRLVGGAARLPFLMALIGIFGGLQVFGLIGLFIGPVIMAALQIVVKEWLFPKE